jgi:hypothetical protein
MSTVIRLLSNWIRYMLSKIFKISENEVSVEHAVGQCKYDEISNMDARVE